MFSRAVTIPVIAHQGRSQRKSCLAIILSLVLLALASSHRVCAQDATTGEITGVVTDPAGAVVPNSSVTLKNIETGATAATTTNSQGIYVFPLLQPGNYQVSVTARGFNTVTKTVLAPLGSSVTANLTLMVQSAQQTIEVTSEGHRNPTSARLAHNDQRQICG